MTDHVRPTRIAVLASGGGSNLQALLDHLRTDEAAGRATVSLVASDRADAGALARATAHDVPCARVAPDDGEEMLSLLATHGIELVVLAGYLRFVPEVVTRRFHGRIVNVHPALLPSFGGHGMYGIRVHRAVLAAGARISGPTVHFVDEVYDRGPIVAQWPVPVLGGDTPESLAKRVLRAEHALYPRAVLAVASGDVRLDESGRVVGAMRGLADGSAFGLLDGSSTLADAVARAF